MADAYVVDGAVATKGVAAMGFSDGSSQHTFMHLDSSNNLKVADAETAALGVVVGAKTDAKSTATDATSISIMQVLKQISASTQAPPSQAVTNAGTFAVQATLAAETTKIIGTVNVAAGQTIAVTNTGTFATQPTIQTGTNQIGHLEANQSVNVAQVNGVTTLMGNGTTGTGSQRVTIASDNTAFSVNATLSAETTKVIGVTRSADGSGNLLTSTGSALDVNLKTSAATNISTNTAQINGVTPLMGAGNTGTGSQRVTIASDQVAIPVTATLTTDTPVVKNGLTNAASAVVSSAAATLNSIYVYNPNTTVAYVQIFDVATAGAVSLGTTVAKWSTGIPPLSAAAPTNLKLAFANGIQVAATTTATGLTALTTAVDANFGYR